jgi:hypothetical protein
MDYSKDQTYNKVKALYDRAGTPGEKQAAFEALKRIRDRLDVEYAHSPAAESYGGGIHIQPSHKTKFYTPRNNIPEVGFYVYDRIAHTYRGPYEEVMVQFQRLNDMDEIVECKRKKLFTLNSSNYATEWMTGKGTRKHEFDTKARFAK